MRGQHKEDVMKQDAGCQDSADDQPNYRDDLQLDSPVKFSSPARRRATTSVYHGQLRRVEAP
jgi:hypothetical protein